MESLGKKELTGLLVNIITVKLVISYPRKIIETAGNSAWITAVYVTLLMLMFYYVAVKLYDFSQPLMDKAKGAGGNVLKIILGAVSLFMLILSMTSIVRLYPESVKIILLPRTPIEITVLLLCAAAVGGAFCGIRAISSVISVFLPVAAVIMAVCVFMIIPNMDVTNLAPVLGPGPKALFIDGIPFVSAFSDILVLFILNINSKDRKSAARCGYKAILISGAVMTVIVLCYCLVFPYNISQYFLMPYYQLTRVAQIGELFTRIEALFEFIWTILVMLYFSVYLYIITHVWKSMFNLKYSKPLAVPFMIVIAGMALAPDIYLQFDKDFRMYAIASIIISTLVPVSVGIFGKIRRKNKSEEIM